MALLDTLVMFCRYISSPRNTGAVCPSSKYLGRKMVKAIGKPASECKTVIELGAGTGAITEQLVLSGYGSNLICIEYDKKLCNLLKRKYENVEIINANAQDLRKLLKKDEKACEITAIVSALPLVSLPKQVVKDILIEVEQSLLVGGRFVQFTYNLKREPDSLGFKNMKHIKRCIVGLNIPPARVDIFEKI